jgi:hypothetical protein
MTKPAGLLFGVVALLTCSAIPAHASPIIYIEQFVGSGSLGGTSFTNALVTITLDGDTATVTGSPGGFEQEFGSAFVVVSGSPVAEFTDPSMDAFDNPSVPAAGISDVTKNLLIMDTINTAFLTYDFRSPIGPVTGPANFNSGAVFPTTAGDFFITSVAEGTSRFSAKFPASPVPEPATIALTACGLAGAAIRRRRSRSAS